MTGLDGLRVIDVDTHLTEPHDLWTSRAPRGWEDRVPRVLNVDGQPSWTVDGVVLGRASASSAVDKDDVKCRSAGFIGWGIEDAHPAAYDVPSRLAVMDELGIWAQIVYPNAAGFGSQKFAEVKDSELRLLCATLYNNAMAEIQEESGQRLFPMALIPWWDLEASIEEAERAKGMGLRGINTTSDPQNHGLPDFGERFWDPLWAACTDLNLPVNFHIGASTTTLSWFGSSPWPSHGADQKLAVGSAMMYLTNARVLANIIFSGMLERFPQLQVVSVESGIGWIPFVLESLDYQLAETASATDYLSMRPSEYFRRQMYACYWFEEANLAQTIEQLGADRVLFETDFPHPTCLYPDSLTHAARALEPVAPDVRRQVVQDNAAALYHIPLPG
jgi:predicted TIM-barrel fold metal-dependent hydrolase